MEGPPVSFARSGGVNIAWHTFGSGLDILAIPPLCSNIEFVWHSPYYRRFLNHMSSHVRVTAFDKRGIGLSDKFFDLPTVDERVGDILAVMDAAGLEQVVIVGASEGGLMAQCFALRYPDRVSKLVLANPAPSRLIWVELAEALGRDAGQPHPTLERFGEMVETWGRDPQSFVDWFAPSYSRDAEFVEWMGRFQRQSATPADIARQVQSIVDIEVTLDQARSITTPTMIVHTAGDRVIPVAASERLAELIPGAQLVIEPGDDHFGEITPRWREMTDAWLEFVTGAPPIGRSIAGRGGSAGWTSLTATEELVADLVQKGLTNRQIGERLGSSARTVETHLSHIFAKLQISTRVELAAFVTERSHRA